MLDTFKIKLKRNPNNPNELQKKFDDKQLEEIHNYVMKLYNDLKEEYPKFKKYFKYEKDLIKYIDAILKNLPEAGNLTVRNGNFYTWRDLQDKLNTTLQKGTEFQMNYIRRKDAVHFEISMMAESLSEETSSTQNNIETEATIKLDKKNKNKLINIMNKYNIDIEKINKNIKLYSYEQMYGKIEKKYLTNRINEIQNLFGQYIILSIEEPKYFKFKDGDVVILDNRNYNETTQIIATFGNSKYILAKQDKFDNIKKEIKKQRENGNTLLKYILVNSSFC